LAKAVRSGSNKALQAKKARKAERIKYLILFEPKRIEEKI